MFTVSRMVKGSRVRVIDETSDNYLAVGHVAEHDSEDNAGEWRIEFDEEWRDNHDVWFATHELSDKCGHVGGVEDTRCVLLIDHEGGHVHANTMGMPESEAGNG